jgi:hypothetical protein
MHSSTDLSIVSFPQIRVQIIGVLQHYITGETNTAPDLTLALFSNSWAADVMRRRMRWVDDHEWWGHGLKAQFACHSREHSAPRSKLQSVVASRMKMEWHHHLKKDVVQSQHGVAKTEAWASEISARGGGSHKTRTHAIRSQLLTQGFKRTAKKQTPWPGSVNELTIPTERPPLVGGVPTFVEREVSRSQCSGSLTAVISFF